MDILCIRNLNFFLKIICLIIYNYLFVLLFVREEGLLFENPKIRTKKIY